MTAPGQPKVPPTQRVSEGTEMCPLQMMNYMICSAGTCWRCCAEKTRAALANAQTALAAKDARIAEIMLAYEQMNDALLKACDDIAEQRARADRLEAQLQAARAAGTREDGLREAAGIAEANGGYDSVNAIRARLTAPAEPTADTGKKG